MPRLAAKTLRRGARGEIEPKATHLSSLRQQLAANRVLRGDFALRVANGNVLGDGLAVGRIVDGVGRDDLSVLHGL